jgi:hypothetical protein
MDGEQELQSFKTIVRPRLQKKHQKLLIPISEPELKPELESEPEPKPEPEPEQELQSSKKTIVTPRRRNSIFRSFVISCNAAVY